MGRVSRTLKHGFNLFQNEPTKPSIYSTSMTAPPGRSGSHYSRYFNDRSIVDQIYMRLAIDFAVNDFLHVLTKDGSPKQVVDSSLNDRLTLDPNIDQNAFALKMDFAYTMFETGHAVLVPVDASVPLEDINAWSMTSLRVGTVKAWHPRWVTVDVYDDRDVDSEGNPVNGGIHKQVIIEKSQVVIVENPFGYIMNNPTGNFQRLKRKLAILDNMDEAAGSGKLDLIFQLPYSTRGEKRRDQAERRRQALADQLRDDDLGIGYIDSSEKVIQLNRPVNSNLPDRIADLQKAVYDELGLSPEILNATASRDAVNNYFDRTIEPLTTPLALEIKRKWLTKVGRTRGHDIVVYRDPLKLIPLNELAEITDKLMRSRLVTPNELRPKIGLFPSDDPAADKLMNPNMPESDQNGSGVEPDEPAE